MMQYEEDYDGIVFTVVAHKRPEIQIKKMIEEISEGIHCVIEPVHYQKK